MYTETHTVSHTQSRLKGDTFVNSAINCTLEREGVWTTKKSTTVQCESIYMNAKQLNSVQGETQPSQVKMLLDCSLSSTLKLQTL